MTRLQPEAERGDGRHTGGPPLPGDQEAVWLCQVPNPWLGCSSRFLTSVGGTREDSDLELP